MEILAKFSVEFFSWVGREILDDSFFEVSSCCLDEITRCSLIQFDSFNASWNARRQVFSERRIFHARWITASKPNLNTDCRRIVRTLFRRNSCERNESYQSKLAAEFRGRSTPSVRPIRSFRRRLTECNRAPFHSNYLPVWMQSPLISALRSPTFFPSHFSDLDKPRK